MTDPQDAVLRTLAQIDEAQAGFVTALRRHLEARKEADEAFWRVMEDGLGYRAYRREQR